MNGSGSGFRALPLSSSSTSMTLGNNTGPSSLVTSSSAATSAAASFTAAAVAMANSLESGRPPPHWPAAADMNALRAATAFYPRLDLASQLYSQTAASVAAAAHLSNLHAVAAAAAAGGGGGPPNMPPPLSPYHSTQAGGGAGGGGQHHPLLSPYLYQFAAANHSANRPPYMPVDSAFMPTSPRFRYLLPTSPPNDPNSAAAVAAVAAARIRNSIAASIAAGAANSNFERTLSSADSMEPANRFLSRRPYSPSSSSLMQPAAVVTMAAPPQSSGTCHVIGGSANSDNSSFYHQQHNFTSSANSLNENHNTSGGGGRSIVTGIGGSVPATFAQQPQSTLNSGEPRRHRFASASLPTQPYYPSHFMKGTVIQLANGDLKRVEDLNTEDFVRSAHLTNDLKIDSSTVVKIDEKSPEIVLLSFAVGEQKVQVSVEATVEHPFFVIGQGWSSCSPERTQNLYGLPCQRLQVGDICISLTHRDASPPSSTMTSSSSATTTTTTTKQSSTVAKQQQQVSTNCGGGRASGKDVPSSKTSTPAVTSSTASTLKRCATNDASSSSSATGGKRTKIIAAVVNNINNNLHNNSNRLPPSHCNSAPNLSRLNRKFNGTRVVAVTTAAPPNGRRPRSAPQPIESTRVAKPTNQRRRRLTSVP